MIKGKILIALTLVLIQANIASGQEPTPTPAYYVWLPMLTKDYRDPGPPPPRPSPPTRPAPPTRPVSPTESPAPWPTWPPIETPEPTESPVPPPPGQHERRK